MTISYGSSGLPLFSLESLILLPRILSSSCQCLTYFLPQLPFY